MNALRRLASIGAVAVLTGYVLVVKAALTPGFPWGLLVSFAVGVLGIFSELVLAHRERLQQMHTATDVHQKAQEALQARVAELDKSLKSLTNVVGSGDWTK